MKPKDNWLWNRQTLVTARGMSQGETTQLIYADGSSGEEQARIHSEILKRSKVETSKVSFDRLVNALGNLAPGQAWSPVKGYSLVSRCFAMKDGYGLPKQGQ
jgi:hypothetical protein